MINSVQGCSMFHPHPVVRVWLDAIFGGLDITCFELHEKGLIVFRLSILFHQGI